MAESKYLGKEILELDDTTYEEVDVPEWGGIIRVRSLTGAERDAYEMSIVSMNGKELSLNTSNMRSRLVAMSVIDEKGKKVFTDRDVNKLGSKSGAALDRVYTVCQRISGLENESFQKSLENLALTPSGGSISD
jgi:hypothetical protein